MNECDMSECYVTHEWVRATRVSVMLHMSEGHMDECYMSEWVQHAW